MDWILELLAFLVAIEKNRSDKLYKESLVLNASSDKSDEKVIDSILGIPITEEGFVPYQHWVAMSEDKRTEFLTK